MNRHAVLGLVASLLASAAPLAAGTVYLPVVSLEQPADGTYKTRVWITNYGSSPAAVKLLYLPGIGDGTSQRSNPETRTVPPGTTIVLFDAAGPGMLEVEAPDEVAVSAELRNTMLLGPREVFGAVPVVGSDQAAEPGETVLLQGLRRSRYGVRSHLGFLNLGHDGASCSASLHATNGDELVGASQLPLPPLSHALIEDVVELASLQQIGDVHARISCDQPFYAYVAVHEMPTGEVVFVRPSPTGASTLEPPGDVEPPPPPPPPPAAGSFVFNRSGTFHAPKRGNPLKYFNIAAPKNREFRRIVLDMDFTHGGWNGAKPEGNHSVFWLHRGACCWPAWERNIVGFVNLFGPNKNFVKAVHNLDYRGKGAYDKTVDFSRSFKPSPGKTYHVRYDYDAAGGTIRLRITQGGKVVQEATAAATTSRIRSGSSGVFMAYFGHDEPKGECLVKACGPEVPSYGWKYSNLRVEFIE